MALPSIAEIGCAILFNALDKVLEIGAVAIPGVGAEMDVGMKSAVQAAKTVAENGQDASSFIQWFAKPCGGSKYVGMINKIFDPLSNVPDSAVPGLGCRGKKCPGNKKAPNKSEGGQPLSTKHNSQPSPTNKKLSSAKDQPTPTKAQPSRTTGQPSSSPKQTSTSCSAKTAPSCVRVCTLVGKSGGGTTTTCASPSCATVTRCSVTATTTTKFTSAASSSSICDASCSKYNATRAKSTSPPGLSRLAKRTFLEPRHYPSLDDLCTGGN